MSLPKCSWVVLAILLGAMLSRQISAGMSPEDPATPRKHAPIADEPYDPDEQFLKRIQGGH